MHTPEEQQGQRDDLLEEITVANVADLRAVRRNCAISLIVRHSDLPFPLSYGTVYMAGSLDRVLEALAENVPEFIRDLEAGISDARGTTFPLADLLSAIFGPTMVGEGVVRDSELR